MTETYKIRRTKLINISFVLAAKTRVPQMPQPTNKAKLNRLRDAVLAPITLSMPTSAVPLQRQLILALRCQVTSRTDRFMSGRL